MNLTCSMIWLRPEDNVSSPLRYSHLSIAPDDKADIFHIIYQSLKKKMILQYIFL